LTVGSTPDGPHRALISLSFVEDRSTTFTWLAGPASSPWMA
jgi:hypothetical protein